MLDKIDEGLRAFVKLMVANRNCLIAHRFVEFQVRNAVVLIEIECALEDITRIKQQEIDGVTGGGALGVD